MFALELRVLMFTIFSTREHLLVWAERGLTRRRRSGTAAWGDRATRDLKFLQDEFGTWILPLDQDGGIMSRRLDCEVAKKHSTPRALGSLLFPKHPLRLPTEQKSDLDISLDPGFIESSGGVELAHIQLEIHWLHREVDKVLVPGLQAILRDHLEPCQG